MAMATLSMVLTLLTTACQATNQLRIPATAMVATLLLGQDIGRQ